MRVKRVKRVKGKISKGAKMDFRFFRWYIVISRIMK